MSPIRRSSVAIVTQGLQYGGGVPTLVNGLNAQLREAGHSVSVFNLATSRNDAQSRRLLKPTTWRTGTSIASSGPDLFEVGSNWVEFERLRYSSRRELTRRLEAFDLVQVVSGAPCLAASVRDVRRPRSLLFATTIESERPTRISHLSGPARLLADTNTQILARLERRVVTEVDHVWAINSQMRNWATEHGAADADIFRPGIDTDFYTRPGGWRGDLPAIGFGRLNDSRKDWPTVIDAFEVACGAGFAGPLIIAGIGPVPDVLRNHARMSRVSERITFQTDLSHEAVAGLLASGSVFIQASKEEGLGIAGLEAMACGLPVVATHTAGSAEYVRHGANGFLAPATPQAAKALGAFIAEVSAGRGESMSRTARTTVIETYSKAASAAGVADVYRRLLQSRRRP